MTVAGGRLFVDVTKMLGSPARREPPAGHGEIRPADR